MSENNFFVKLAHFYIVNIKGLKDDAVEIWDEFIDEILPSLIKIFFNILIIISRIIYCFLPIKQIRNSLMTEYLIIRQNGVITHGDYHLKKDVRQLIAEIEENKEDDITYAKP